MPDLVGSTIGQYEIVDRLGRGGMATVYKGYQAALDRYVAIKVLDTTVSSEELFLARFQREARAVALLRHPHIVQIYDFGNIDDMYYMVMEYVDGQSLRERVKAAAAENKYMSVENILAVVWGISSALDYAYQRGIIHRDIKPGNILLSSDGQAVLSDFGIAQMITSSRLTLSGLVGTPNYMSPEQGQGLEIDQRTDIYSLGIVTYEMLTNHVPFSSDTPFAVVMAHVTRPLPSLEHARPDLPPIVEDVLVKATAKEKEQRYYRAMEFAESLEAALSPVLRPTVAASPDETSLVCVRCHSPLEPGQRFCGKCGAHAGAIPIVPSKDAGSPVVPGRSRKPEAATRSLKAASAGGASSASASQSVSRTASQPSKRTEAITPPPATQVEETPSKSKSWVLIGALIGLLILLLLLGVGVVWPMLQRDGQQLAAAQLTATVTVGSLETIGAGQSETLVANSKPITSSEVITPLTGTVEPDDVTAAFTEAPENNSTMAPPATSTELPVSTPTAPPTAISTQSPTFTHTPTATPTETSTTVIAANTLIATANLTPTETTQTGMLVLTPSRTATSKTMSTPTKPPTNTSTLTLMATPGDTPTLTATVYIGVIGSPTTSPGLRASPTSAPVLATLTPESLIGQILFKTDRDDGETVYIMNPDGSNQKPLEDMEVYQKALNREQLSPDGTERLRVQDNSGNWDIYMGPTDEHKSPMAITSHAAADYDPVWSPVENLIAFVSLRSDGQDAIFVMTPDGRNDKQITFTRGALDKHPSWSPDGSQIAFGSNRDGNRQIYIMDKSGSNQINISSNPYNDWDPIWLK